MSIKENLIFLIKPIESEINDSNRLPMVRDLSPRTVDDVRHLVSDNKLQVLYQLPLKQEWKIG